MQIILQKRYLILYEIAENVFALFLVIVNFVFFITEKIENTIKTIFNYLSFFVNKFRFKSNKKLTNYFFVRNDFVIYSNLLAPPSV